MRRRTMGAATAILLVGSSIALPTPPAGAAVTATTAGTVVNVTATGATIVSFSCSGGKVAVNGAVPAPALNCSAVTRVNVTGDDSSQTVNGDQLGASAFSAGPFLDAETAGGIDFVRGTPRPDIIDLGPGNDTYSVLTTDAVADASVQLGSGTDQLSADGTPGNDSMSTSSNSGVVTLTLNPGSGAFAVTAQSVETLGLRGNGGNDAISVAGVTVASTLSTINLIGGAGNDTLTGGAKAATFFGQDGTNTMNGGSGSERFSTDSSTDTINPGGGSNTIFDTTSLRLGRTISNQGTSNQWAGAAGYNRDAILRYRTVGSGSQITASLDRSGTQSLGSTFEDLQLRTSSGVPTVNALHLIDAVMPPAGRVLEIYGDPADDDLIDITVPVGGWATAGTPADVYEVNPTDPSLGAIVVTDGGTVFIHGPWTNKDRGFVHRATRDLQLRFEVAGVRNALGDQLTSGTLTRSALVASLVDSDLRRGVDVDRTFRRFLRRGADPGGRAYWIDSLDAGKAPWRFRAQLIGSNEYFTKAGATNGNYVLQAYRDVLGRDPDPSGKAFWTAKLDGGANRGSVALQFLNSPEARRRLVDDHYLRFLDRLPTALESDTWVPAMSTATGETDLLASLAASGAYYNRS